MLSDQDLYYRAQNGDLAAAAELAQRNAEYTAANERRWQAEWEASQADTRPVKRVRTMIANEGYDRKREG